MSGFVSLYYPNGRPVDPVDLSRMVDILAHRGPDAADMWYAGSVGLGHRMLWTTPESLHEKLPLVSRSGRYVITADARIDNRADLIAALNLIDRPAAELTDSDLILAAYEKWGTNCPQKLLGAFAFAIWDQTEQQLFCARDHFGVKPFYYYYRPGHLFACGSEIKALLCLTDVPKQLNQIRVADYLVSMVEDKVSTFYQNIQRLLPGHYLTVSTAGQQLHSYWSLDPTHELILNSDQEYIERFREIFFEAVRCRLRAKSPLGTTLSGGLDSSSVTCIARDLLAENGGNPLHTFSYIFDQVPQCDERPFIKEVLKKEGFISYCQPGDNFSPLIDLEQVLWHLEEPSIGPSMFFPWQWSKAFKHMGVCSYLDGFDGDTTISHGTGYLAELAYQGQWATFHTEASALSKHFDTNPLVLLKNYGLPQLQQKGQNWQWLKFLKSAQTISIYFGINFNDLILRYGLKPFVPDFIRQLRRRLLFRSGQASVKRVNSLINTDFAKRIKLAQRVQALTSSNIGQTVTLRQEHWQNLTSGALSNNLEMYDRLTSAFAVEARHPFMDKRLIEFCLALPPDQKLRQGWTRWILRNALLPELPEVVQQRSIKTNFNDNFMYTLRTFESERLKQVLFSNQKLIASFVNINFVHQAYHRFINEESTTSINDAMIIWRAVTLTLWLQHIKFSS